MELITKLTGFKELADALRELPDDISKNVLRSAVGAGAAVVRVEAKNNALAMKRTGTLARSIYQKQIRELSGPEKQTFYVGARFGKKKRFGKKGKDLSNEAYYARFVELGHFSRPSKKGAGGRVVWVPAHPFLRPAFDVRKDQAVEAIGAKISERLLKIKVGK